jgi:hypothetical protein
MSPRLRIATVALFSVAIAILYWLYVSGRRPDEKAISAAEDQVYEAVVRDMMVGPAHGQPHISQLVFKGKVLTFSSPQTDLNSCKERARKALVLENSKLPYDSLIDKVYGLFSHGYDDTLRADTIQNFLERSCIEGRLSQTFHTDLPRTFVTADSIPFHFRDLKPIEDDGSKLFDEVFPGASGVISFSHVGFDSTFHEAIVATSFVCGGLCGGGSHYVLRKRSGHWEVVNKWLVWMA